MKGGLVDDVFHFYSDDELRTRIAHWEQVTQGLALSSFGESAPEILQAMYQSRDMRVEQQLLKWGTQ